MVRWSRCRTSPPSQGTGSATEDTSACFQASLVLHKAGTTAFAQDTFLERPSKHGGSQHPQMLWESQRGLHTTRPGMDSTQESCSQLCSGPHTMSQLQGGVGMGSLKARRHFTTDTRKQKYPGSKKARDLWTPSTSQNEWKGKKRKGQRVLREL